MPPPGARPGAVFALNPDQREHIHGKCKAESAGIPFVEVPPAGTSQECSRCGTKIPKALSERTHQCGVCGLELDRNENAARNVLCRGLRIFAGTAAAGGTAQGAPAASAAR